MSAYKYYTREDALCQTNGYFSLNLRPKCVDSIDRLLQLSDEKKVGWVGCGDGREMLSIATRYENVSFHGYDINESALHIARRVMNMLGITNVSLQHRDFMTVSDSFTHIYSTAIVGPEFYAHLVNCCTQRIVWLDVMQTFVNGESDRETVRLSGSGEQRQLIACKIPLPSSVSVVTGNGCYNRGKTIKRKRGQIWDCRQKSLAREGNGEKGEGRRMRRTPAARSR